MINNLPIVILAIFFNVLAQCLMKYHSTINVAAGLSSLFSFTIAGAVASYFFSFLFSIFVYKHNELSVASPVMGGVCFILITVCSSVFFNEIITKDKIVGVLLITAGIYFLNR